MSHTRWGGAFRVGRLLATAVLCLGFAIAAVPTVAGAHACGSPMEIPVGRASRVDVPVTAGEQPLVAVEIAVPAGFRVDAVQPKPGWQIEQRPDRIAFTGTMEPYSCAPFSLEGVATARATLRFPVVLRQADGTAAPYASEEDADHGGAQVVYAGTSPPSVPSPEPVGPTGGSSANGVMIAIVAFAVLVGSVLLLRRPRASS